MEDSTLLTMMFTVLVFVGIILMMVLSTESSLEAKNMGWYEEKNFAGEDKGLNPMEELIYEEKLSVKGREEA